MSSYGPLVEREMERIAPPNFSLEDLRHRRVRKQRNQRIGAGVVALAMIGAVVGGLGWALTRGLGPDSAQDPAGPAIRVPAFTPENLEEIVLGSEETPGGAEHHLTAIDRRAVEAPLKNASELSVPDLMDPGTGFLAARTTEFLADLGGIQNSVFFGSVAILYDDDESAGRAHALLIQDFKGRDEAATQAAAPVLGQDAVVVRGTLIKPAGSTDAVYIWRIENLVLIAAGGDSPGRGAPLETRSVAEEMNARALAVGPG